MAVAPFSASAVFPAPAPQLPPAGAGRCHLPWLQGRSSLLCAGHAAPSIVSGERRGPVPLSLSPGALLAAPTGVRVLPHSMGGENPFICTREIKDGRPSPWGQISPPSAPAQTPSKIQMSSVDPWWEQDGQGGWECSVGFAQGIKSSSTAGKLPGLQQQQQAHRQSHFLPKHRALMDVTSPGAKSCPSTGGLCWQPRHKCIQSTSRLSSFHQRVCKASPRSAELFYSQAIKPCRLPTPMELN